LLIAQPVVVFTSQVRPHIPQFAAWLLRSKQPPGQHVLPAAHAGPPAFTAPLQVHWLPVHTSLAPHAMPHAPQSVSSVAIVTQPPWQQLCAVLRQPDIEQSQRPA